MLPTRRGRTRNLLINSQTRIQLSHLATEAGIGSEIDL